VRSAAGRSTDRLPRAVGKYLVVERIGMGGMGVVYKCTQPGLDRPVAVKVLSAARHASAEQIARFEREARAAARLTHPNVVQVYDVGTEGEWHYFVMEYVDGRPLDRLIGTPFLTEERTLLLLYPLARAVQAAHEQGIIHRDIKPSNVLVHRSGEPKLADFGLAKPVEEGSGLSGPGDLIGTPRYMSPEQVLAAPEEIDARTDVYSLGAVMYEMLTGRSPVDGPNVLAILRRLTDGAPVPVRELSPGVSPAAAAVCERALAQDRADRFGSAGEFAEAIRVCLGDQAVAEVPGIGPLPELPPPAPGQGAGVRPRWLRSRGLLLCAAGLPLLVLAGVLLLAPFGRRGGLAKEGAGAANEADRAEEVQRPAEPAANLAQLRLQLQRVPSFGDAATARDLLRSVLEELNPILKQFPNDRQALFLRARAQRCGGEYLAAIRDLDRLLRLEPPVPATLERLLASYQLYVLYFGNLGEGILRPPVPESLRLDSQELLHWGNAWQQALARLTEALARRDYAEAERQVADATVLGPSGEHLPDMAMLRADALFHAADAAHAEEQAAADQEKEAKRRRREDLVRRAVHEMRRGLDADPNHVGLLFLRAHSFPRPAVWEAGEGEDWAAVLRRNRPLFETAVNRLRSATLRSGCDTPIARAVLLTRYGRDDPALDQVLEALSSQPTLPHLHTWRAWLRLHAPVDGVLTTDEVDRVLRDLAPVFETPPEEFNPYFVRALLHAAAGRWEDARRDLRQCRRLLGNGPLSTNVGPYAAWFDTSAGSTTEFLDAAQDVCQQMPVTVDLRIQLSTTVLQRLADTAVVKQDGLQPEQVNRIRGWTHYRLALAHAGKEDRDGVLRHVREGLQARLPDLTPKAIREDATLRQWNADQEFVKLYEQYEKP
jgi:tetratricopeptide (TPR) repeat protein/predicted Ser/Thr protein kinase